jgi:hypothetical protein
MQAFRRDVSRGRGVLSLSHVNCRNQLERNSATYPSLRVRFRRGRNCSVGLDSSKGGDCQSALVFIGLNCELWGDEGNGAIRDRFRTPAFPCCRSPVSALDLPLHQCGNGLLVPVVELSLDSNLPYFVAMMSLATLSISPLMHSFGISSKVLSEDRISSSHCSVVAIRPLQCGLAQRRAHLAEKDPSCNRGYLGFFHSNAERQVNRFAPSLVPRRKGGFFHGLAVLCP